MMNYEIRQAALEEKETLSNLEKTRSRLAVLLICSSFLSGGLLLLCVFCLIPKMDIIRSSML